MKISTVLEKARWELYPAGTNEFSCDAVASVFVKRDRSSYREVGELAEPTLDFLRSLGVDTDSLTQFSEFERWPSFPCNSEVQGARFLWLDFARRVAKDEGL